jgi:predicted ATP-dependent endonuclease of OLD family
MYGLSDIAIKISENDLSRKELKHYLKYHLKAFASIYLNNRRTFTEEEFIKIVEYLKTSKVCTSCTSMERYTSGEGWFDKNYSGPKFFLD